VPPCLSPDGKQIAWGSGDHEVVLAPIDLDSDSPSVGQWRLRIQDKTKKLTTWIGRRTAGTVSLSLGPASKGDPTKPGTFLAACEDRRRLCSGLEPLRRFRRSAMEVVDLGNGLTGYPNADDRWLSNKESRGSCRGKVESREVMRGVWPLRIALAVVALLTACEKSGTNSEGASG
jgi:hypothetical protein